MAYDVEQLLTTESGRIGPDIYERTLNTSPYLKLVKQGVWPDEMGSSIKVMTYERSLPLASNNVDYQPQAWTTVSDNNGSANSGGNCTPAANKVGWAQSTKSYSIEQTSLESPDICVNDLRSPVNRKAQLSAILRILTENTKYIWVERFRTEYTRLAEHKVVCAPDASGVCPKGSSAFPVTPATTQLTPNLMKRFYMQLNRDGAGDMAVDRLNNRPLYVAILSSEASENLLLLDPSFREDVRYSAKVNDLLAPLGVERSYKGFFHLIDDFAPRWNLTNGVWVRVYPYVGSAADTGRKVDINPAYEIATHEDTILFHPMVFTNLTPKPITAPGAGMAFDAVNYRGDFKWLNIQDRVDNPDKTIGFFRGVFQTASEPGVPSWGIVLRHLRCGAPVTKITCSGT